jgi:hypothetical protein
MRRFFGVYCIGSFMYSLLASYMSFSLSIVSHSPTSVWAVVPSAKLECHEKGLSIRRGADQKCRYEICVVYTHNLDLKRNTLCRTKLNIILLLARPNASSTHMRTFLCLVPYMMKTTDTKSTGKSTWKMYLSTALRQMGSTRCCIWV